MRTRLFRALIFSCVSWLVVAGVSAQAPRTIEKGDQSNVDDPTQVVIRDGTEWRKLWQRHAPDRPLPAVDFSKESVVAVFMGSRPTAGYGIAILSTTEGGGALIVRYRETRPVPGRALAQVLTFPYHIVAIAKSTAPNVKFEKDPNP